jgi:hypothetical protein
MVKTDLITQGNHVGKMTVWADVRDMDDICLPWDPWILSNSENQKQQMDVVLVQSGLTKHTDWVISKQ